ncbi:MAG: Rpn family recombination-promoting nuclease/putative transposase, partial [Bacteroidales bacterium]
MSKDEKYLNPLTDFGFKKLFGTELNKDILIDFLNDIIPDLPPNHRIKDISYKPTEHLPDFEFDRKAIFDIYCVGQNGHRFIVEMQKYWQAFFKDRSIYYSTYLIREQAERGEWDFKLDAVYTVGILDFLIDTEYDNPEPVHKVELKNERNKIIFDKLMYVYVELPKFTKQEHELETMRDKWLFTLKNLVYLQERPRALQERVFEKIFEIAEVAKFN